MKLLVIIFVNTYTNTFSNQNLYTIYNMQTIKYYKNNDVIIKNFLFEYDTEN